MDLKCRKTNFSIFYLLCAQNALSASRIHVLYVNLPCCFTFSTCKWSWTCRNWPHEKLTQMLAAIMISLMVGLYLSLSRSNSKSQFKLPVCKPSHWCCIYPVPLPYHIHSWYMLKMNEHSTYGCLSYPCCDVIDSLKIQVIKPRCFCVTELSTGNVLSWIVSHWISVVWLSCR